MEHDNCEQVFPVISVACKSCTDTEMDNELHRNEIYDHCSCWYHSKEDKNERKQCQKFTSESEIQNQHRKHFEDHVILCLSTLTIIGYIFIGSLIIVFYENELEISDGSLPVAFLFGKSISSPDKITESNMNDYKWFTGLIDHEENRKNIVHNIWNITVSLNILYQHNWTMLAIEELILFQKEVEKRFWNKKMYVRAEITENNNDMQPNIHDLDNPPMHWKLAKGFLQSLCIISTIGLGYGDWLANLPSSIKFIFILYSFIGFPLMFLYISNIAVWLSSFIKQSFLNLFMCCCCYYHKTLTIEKNPETRSTNSSYPIAAAVVATQGFKTYSPIATTFPAHSPMEINDCCSNKNTHKHKLYTFFTYSDSVIDKYLKVFVLYLVCIIIGIFYSVIGFLILWHFDVDWCITDSFYFIFMMISTIGTVNSVPSNSVLNPFAKYQSVYDSALICFFSVYLIIGLVLSGACLSIILDNIQQNIEKR